LKPSGVGLTANSKTQLRWFARQLRPLLRAHLLGMSLMVLSSLMFLLDPLLIKWLIDRILPKRIFTYYSSLRQDFSESTSAAWAFLHLLGS